MWLIFSKCLMIHACRLITKNILFLEGFFFFILFVCFHKIPFMQLSGLLYCSSKLLKIIKPRNTFQTDITLPVNCVTDEYLPLMTCMGNVCVCVYVSVSGETYWLFFKDSLNVPHGWSLHAPFLSAMEESHPGWPRRHGWGSSSSCPPSFAAE